MKRFEEIKAQFPGQDQGTQYSVPSGYFSIQARINTKEEALDIANFLRTNPVKYLDFISCHITPEAMAVLANQGISHCPLLQTINLENAYGFGDIGAAAIAHAVSENKRITTVRTKKIDEESARVINEATVEHQALKQVDYSDAKYQFVALPLLQSEDHVEAASAAGAGYNPDLFQTSAFAPVPVDLAGDDMQLALALEMSQQ